MILRLTVRLSDRWTIAMTIIALLSLVDAGLQARPQTRPVEQRTGHLFPPENLGLLESPDRDDWQRPEQIMDALGIAEGSKVADIGIGSGWFTIRLARRVGPNGLVYAEDVQRQMLEATRRRVSREGLKNVETQQGTDTDPNLPARALDAILMVDVYPEIDDRFHAIEDLNGGDHISARFSDQRGTSLERFARIPHVVGKQDPFSRKLLSVEASQHRGFGCIGQRRKAARRM